MRNFDLNTGGIIGGAAGALLAVVVVVTLFFDARPIGFVAAGIAAGVVLGNVIWGQFFERNP